MIRMNIRAALAFLPVIAVTAPAADWPQYGGPELNRTTPERIGARFPAAGPKAIWRVPMENGFSSIAVSDGRAFTLVLRNSGGAPRETVVAFDAATGKELWSAPLGPVKINDGGHQGTPDNNGGDGPRSTPSVVGDHVYVLSAKLVLSCFEAGAGQRVWSKDLIREHAGRNVSWDNAASPLVEGDLVFVGGGGPGQSLLAFNRLTGAVAWKAHDDRITHATPVAATIHGERQVIFFTQAGLVSVKPQDGSLLWRHSFPYRTSTAASPVVAGDIVYCAAGYGVGATAVRIVQEANRFAARELWFSRGNQPVANHWSTPVYHNGHLYGMFSFKEYGDGPLKCVELATGKVKWEQRGFGAGNAILAGDTVLALSDRGELVTVETSPAAYREISRAKVVAGKCWSTPTVANGRIYVRSTKEGACLEAPVAVATN